MGSKTSKIKHPTSAGAKTVGVPRIPQDIIDDILDHLVIGSDFKSLQSCALISKSWVPLCRRYLFHTLLFTSRDTAKWLKAFPIPEESPAHHVKDLRFLLGEFFGAPSRRFSEHIPWFTNVEKVTLSGRGGCLPSWMPSLGRLPRSVTSLIINMDMVSLARVRDVLVQLPNLNDLSLSGPLIVVDKSTLPGMGTTLGGKFGGQLRLFNGCAEKDVMNMLLEVPTGLHLTEMYIRGAHKSFPSTVSLTEACGKSLVKLSYAVSIHGRCGAFGRSFDFSGFPNLQEVDLGADQRAGGLLWISVALSTLKYTTSPRLSALQLNFITSSTTTHTVEDVGNDLRLAADEVARIEREFEGAVKVTVLRDPGYKVVFDTLNILQHQDR